MSDRPPWWKGTRGEWLVVGQVILMAAVALAPPAWRWTAPSRALWVALGVPLVIAGGWLGLRALYELGPNLTILPRPRPGGEFVQTGLYARTRHPAYGGLLVAAVGWALWRTSGLHLVLAAVLTLYIHAKAHREEAFLMERFPDYADYRARTKHMVPRIY
ncbi:MAG: isoprenylcysteine carboxylmethyltransferase family protein [bacterium]|nr:isoprenylcysteine carboxylmethyltransferase family protein [bacterium]